MSEHDHEARWLITWLLIGFAIYGVFHYGVYVRDLQRRVGQLEESVKR